jgi:hypothetical protein
LVAAGAVFAQAPTATPAARGDFVDANNDGICDVCGETGSGGRGGRWGGRGGMMGGLMGRGSESSLVGVVAKALNMTVTDVQAEVSAGKTLKQVIEAHQGNASAIVDSYIATRKVTLDEQVKAGRLTQAQADQMLATMRTQVMAHLEQSEADCATQKGMRGGRWATPDTDTTKPNGTAPRGRGMRGGGMMRGGR